MTFINKKDFSYSDFFKFSIQIWTNKQMRSEPLSLWYTKSIKSLPISHLDGFNSGMQIALLKQP